MEFSERISHAYLFAKHYVISKGYGNEIDWQDGLIFEEITEQKFLHEISWVILASGMNDLVVRKIFPSLKKIFFDFCSSEIIYENKLLCRERALIKFKHKGKIDAILFASEYINNITFCTIKNLIHNEGISFIQSFPYMGPATSYHLAKNIGLDVAKPDRHLKRMASALGFENPNELCLEISKNIQEKVSLIDLVLWRYATLDKNYINNINRYINKYN